jgi:primosomal protein N' (replication factor Y) (superfamily II helicase)
MFAEIIVFRRLPKQFETLLYSIPDECIEALCVGCLVEVPFRKTKAFGLIFSIIKENEPTTIKDIRPIINIISPKLLSKEYIEWYHSISKLYNTPINTLIKKALPPIKKRKLKKIEEDSNQYIPTKQHKIKKENILLYSNHVEKMNVLLSHKKKKVLILFPEIQMLEKAKKSLLEHKIDCIEWHSQVSEKNQFEAWLAIQQMKKGFILGTRGTLFLPILDVDTIIIDGEHDDNHKHWDQSPRFHVKDIVKQILQYSPAECIYLDFFPSTDTYKKIYTKEISLIETSEIKKPKIKQDCLFHRKQHNIEIIDQNDDKKGNNFSPFSFQAQNAILEATGDIFLFLNRKGFNTALFCTSCNNIQSCNTCHLPVIYYKQEQLFRCHYCNTSQKATQICSHCEQGILQPRGFGTEAIESEVRTLLKNSNELIIRIDGTTEKKYPLDEPKRKIIIGTQMAFQYIDWDSVKLIIFVDIDRQLAQPEYNATEGTWHTIWKTQYMRNTDSRFLIQTHNPQSTIFRSLGEPDRFYRTELQLRKALFYPPYSYFVRCFYGHFNKDVAKKQAENAYTQINSTLTKDKKCIIIDSPYEMHPNYYRKKYWYGILFRLQPKTWYEDTQWISKFFGPGWRIDPNPISILSP